ncbi:hypothetical protein GCM10007385_45880 [Tateyamaria omphalii]|nr:hypothetical protein [Tateyamaria omphalii]GGX71777.1 hypothetical protein GCM10007385_45880 [Tateyamaria omphalii]
MKAMMLGFAALIVISVGSYFALQELGFSSEDRGSGDAVRLD